MMQNARVRLFSFQHLTWPMRMITLLLFVQAAGLFTIGAVRLARLQWEVNSEPEVIVKLFLTAIADNVVFTALALLALLAMFRFWGMRPIGWGLVMLVQGLILALALVNYFRTDDAYVFVLMIYAIFMVAYLYHPEVYEPCHRVVVEVDKGVRIGANDVE